MRYSTKSSISSMQNFDLPIWRKKTEETGKRKEKQAEEKQAEINALPVKLKVCITKTLERFHENKHGISRQAKNG